MYIFTWLPYIRGKHTYTYCVGLLCYSSFQSRAKPHASNREMNNRYRLSRFFFLTDQLESEESIGHDRPIMKSKKNEELQSRREFFKRAAKAALPIVGAVVLANAPIIAKAATPDDCKYGCSSLCYSSCRGSCQYNCYTGCQSNCRGGCSGSCQGCCQASCSGSCRGSNY